MLCLLKLSIVHPPRAKHIYQGAISRVLWRSVDRRERGGVIGGISKKVRGKKGGIKVQDR